MADVEYTCDPMCLPCENTASISNSLLSWRTTVLNLLCDIRNGAGISQLRLAPSSVQTIAADGVIAVGSTYIEVVSDGGAVTVTSEPTIPAGTKGDIIILVGTSDTDSVRVEDKNVLPGSNLKLGSTHRVLGLDDSLVLLYTGVEWIELNYSGL